MTGGSKGSLVRPVSVAAIMAIAILGLIVSVANDVGSDVGAVWSAVAIMWSAIPVVFTICGALIVWKQPGNGVGWALMAPGLATALWLMPVVRSPQPPVTLNFLTWFQIWIDSISWMLLFFPVFFLFLIFPTGRLLSSRWKILVALQLLMVVGLGALAAIADSLGPLDADWTVDNPIGVLDDSFFEGAFIGIWTVLLMVVTLSGVLAVVLRFKRGTRTERQQIKWLLLAVSVFGATYGVLAVNPDWQEGVLAVDLALILSLTAIPVAIVIAVTRYRLYEIDRLVSRTLTYALLAGIIATFVALVATLVGTRFEDPILVAVTTLAVAATFHPLRRRLQSWVDRRFNRSRYDIEEVMTTFAGSLRHHVDTDRVVEGLIDVVAGTMQPAMVSVWVRD